MLLLRKSFMSPPPLTTIGSLQTTNNNSIHIHSSRGYTFLQS